MEWPPSPLVLLFCTRLKERRISLGLTQRQILEKTGIAVSYISSLERMDGNPTLEIMGKLADALGLEVWEMLRPTAQLNSKATENEP